MTGSRNRDHSEFGSNGSSRRRTGKRNHGERLPKKSQQEYANGHDGSWTHQEERVGPAGVVIETRTSCQDPRTPSETSAESSWPRRGNQTGHHAEARVQMLPWQDHPGPYDNTTYGTGLDYGDPRGHNFAAGAQKLSWQDHPGPFENVPDRNMSQQRDRIGQNRAVVEKTALWQDHPGSSETVPNGRRPHQENRAGKKVGAAVQPASWEDHSWPNYKRTGEHVRKQRDQRERSNSARLPLQTSPSSFDDKFTQSSSSNEKSCETGASVCLPDRKWAQHVRDQESHQAPVAVKKLQFFNPDWAPHPLAQDSAPVSAHKILNPCARHKTAHEVIEAHLGIKKCHRRGRNSRNEENGVVHVVTGEHDRRRPKVTIPKRQCYYNRSKPGDSFPTEIPALEPVASSFEYSRHGAVQENKDTPTVCLPGKDCYGESIVWVRSKQTEHNSLMDYDRTKPRTGYYKLLFHQLPRMRLRPHQCFSAGTTE